MKAAVLVRFWELQARWTEIPYLVIAAWMRPAVANYSMLNGLKLGEKRLALYGILVKVQ